MSAQEFLERFKRLMDDDEMRLVLETLPDARPDETLGAYFRRCSPALDDYRHAQPCPECHGNGFFYDMSIVSMSYIERPCGRCDGSGQIGREIPRGQATKEEP